MAHSKDIVIQYFDGQLPDPLAGAASDTLKTAVVAIETKGTYPRRGKLVELAISLVETRRQPAQFVRVLDKGHWFADPEESLPESYTELTGLSEEMLAGKSIDRDRAANMLKEAKLIIAYDAGNARPFLEREIPGLEDKIFACARNQVDWTERGCYCRMLQYLARDHKWWFDSLRADVQVAALIKLLSETVPEDEPSYLQELSERANEPLIMVEADVEPQYRKLLQNERFFYSRDRGVYTRQMGESTLRRVRAALESRGFSGELVEKERLPASQRFKLS